VQKLFVDTQTGLLLRREVRDARGRTERSLEFKTLTIDGGVHALDEPGVRRKEAPSLRSVPDGYRAPSQPGAGYVLVSKARDPAGGVQLSYSDGLFTISIYEQRGELDWSGLAKGGTTQTIAGHAVHPPAAALQNTSISPDRGVRLSRSVVLSSAIILGLNCKAPEWVSRFRRGLKAGYLRTRGLGDAQPLRLLLLRSCGLR